MADWLAGCDVIVGWVLAGEPESMYAEHPEVSVASRTSNNENTNRDGLGAHRFLRARTGDRFPEFG